MDDRQKYLGGTDAAAVLGLSRWKTPLSVWAEKCGKVQEKDLEDVEAAQLGLELEDYVAKRFCRKADKKVMRLNETLYHKQYSFIGANIDRRIVGEKAGLECKTTSAWKAKEWEGEEIPTEYILQCVHYLAVTGWDAWYIACLIGNHKFVWKKISRDDKIIADLIDKETKFWNGFVVPVTMPMTIKSGDGELLTELYPAQDKEVELGDEVNAVIENLDSLKADRKVLDREIEEQENFIKAKLQEATTGLTCNYKITWKPMVSKRIDSKKLKEEKPEIYEQYSCEKESRVLRIYEKKENENETK